MIRRDVIFNEKEFNMHSENKSGKQRDAVEVNPNFEDQSDDDSRQPIVTPTEHPRRSERRRRPPVRYGLDEYADLAKEDQVCHSAYHACQISEPLTIAEAFEGEHAKQ